MRVQVFEAARYDMSFYLWWLSSHEIHLELDYNPLAVSFICASTKTDGE